MANEAQTETVEEVKARLSAVWAMAKNALAISEHLVAMMNRAETDEVTAELFNTVDGYPFRESLEDVQARVRGWATNLLDECARLADIVSEMHGGA